MMPVLLLSSTDLLQVQSGSLTLALKAYISSIGVQQARIEAKHGVTETPAAFHQKT